MQALALLLLVTAVRCAAGGCPPPCECQAAFVNCDGGGRGSDLLEASSLSRDTLRLHIKGFSVPELRLDKLSELRELRLDDCGLSRLPDLGTNGALTLLSAAGNSLAEVPPGLASGAPLGDLDLSRNQIAALAAPLPSSLRRLDLSHNKIANVAEGAFANMTILDTLLLANNRLEWLPGGCLLGLWGLQALDLSGNQLRDLGPGLFQDLGSLRDLRLAANPLPADLRLDLFGARPLRLDLTAAGLERIPQSLSRFVSELRLSKNNLKHLSTGDLDSYPLITDLWLEECGIQEVESDTLGRLERLVSLWMNANLLIAVPSPLPPSLRVLQLRGNRLAEVTAGAFEGASLSALFLAGNRIARLDPCAFCDQPALRELELSNNQLIELPAEVFQPLGRLEVLELSGNRLKLLDSISFMHLKRVTELGLAGLDSEVADPAFDALPALQVLNLRNSTRLTQAVLASGSLLGGLRGLKQLDLRENGIETLRSDFSSFFPVMEKVWLGLNPWRCDMRLRWLCDWFKYSKTSFIHNSSMACASPESMKSKLLMSLRDSDFQELGNDAEVWDVSSNETDGNGETIMNFDNSTERAAQVELVASSDKDSEALTRPPQSSSVTNPAEINDKFIINFGPNLVLVQAESRASETSGTTVSMAASGTTSLPAPQDTPPAPEVVHPPIIAPKADDSGSGSPPKDSAIVRRSPSRAVHAATRKPN